MNGQTATLTDFLLARIKEDEGVARAAGVGAWEAGERCVWRESPIATLDIVTDGAAGDGGVETPEIADHIARHDPARVLSECEAKRRIVEEHGNDYGDCATCSDGDDGACGDPECCGPASTVMKSWPCPTLRALAMPYTSHPDFRPEWRA